MEAQAVEEALDGEAARVEAPPPLPQPRPAGELDVWRDEVRPAALAAAGGIVAGAATVAAVRALRAAPGPSSRSGILRRSKRRAPNIVASRSFLVDVHVLGR